MDPVEPRTAARVGGWPTAAISIRRRQSRQLVSLLSTSAPDHLEVESGLEDNPPQVVEHDRRGEEQAVEPVGDAAVAGDEAARVLDAEGALQRRLRQVAEEEPVAAVGALAQEDEVGGEEAEVEDAAGAPEPGLQAGLRVAGQRV